MSFDLLSIIIPFVTGVLGYIVKEWQNHWRPLTSVLCFNGNFNNPTIIVELPNEIIDKLNDAIFINKLNKKESLPNITKTINEGKAIIDEIPKMNLIIDDCIEAIKTNGTNKTILDELSDLFQLQTIDYIVNQIIFYNQNEIITPELEIKEIITPTLSNYNEGCYTFNVPGKPFGVGAQINKEPLIHEMYKPFIRTIACVYRPGIMSFLEFLKKKVNKELLLANAILPKLEELRNANSSWEVDLYIANLKRTPILIDKTIILHVKDSTGASFYEDCMLISKKEEDETNIKVSECPIILSSGNQGVFSFVTKKTQGEMTRGNAFRDAFNSHNAYASINFSIIGVGIKRRTTYVTGTALFQ